jgi:hypothetical protein
MAHRCITSCGRASVFLEGGGLDCGLGMRGELLQDASSFVFLL